MVYQYRPNFPHRLNADGSYNSICTLCHMTVARTKIEAELSQYEQNHKCSLVRFDQLREHSRSLQSTAFLSFCRRLRIATFWVACPWRVLTDIRGDERPVQGKALSSDS